MGAVESERTQFRRDLRRGQTEAERTLWYRMRDRRLAGFKFVRQESVGRYVADFCYRDVKLIIELDGSQHAESNADRIRDARLTERSYQVLRFWNADIMNNLAAILETILAALPPSPRTRGEGRGDLVVGAASPHGEGEGPAQDKPISEPSPHHRLPPRRAPARGTALSPRAGRGGARA